MKNLTLFLLILLTPLLAEEKPLTDVDRQLLLEKLKSIQEDSDNTLDGRFGVALSAFKKARESSAAAHELYLNCVEKIRFQEEVKKNSEFREWKSRHKERTDTPGFRLALRHQLNWLVLSLEAAKSPDLGAMSTQSLAVLEAILREAEELKGLEDFLKNPVLDSVFAKAYDIENIKITSWPESPLAIQAIYDSIVLPPLRDPKLIPQLREAWLKRIEHEGLLLEKWTDEGSADKDRKPAFEKWLAEGRKVLTWQMEVDLFTAGDQRAAALRMLEHLKANLTHKSAPKWIEQFTSLVEANPDQEDAAKTE